MLLAWTTRALFESGLDSAPWNGDNVTSDDAMGYFLGEVIGTKTLNKEDGNRPTRLVGQNVGVSALIALFIFICLSRSKFIIFVSTFQHASSNLISTLTSITHNQL